VEEKKKRKTPPPQNTKNRGPTANSTPKRTKEGEDRQNLGGSQGNGVKKEGKLEITKRRPIQSEKKGGSRETCLDWEEKRDEYRHCLSSKKNVQKWEKILLRKKKKKTLRGTFDDLEGVPHVTKDYKNRKGNREILEPQRWPEVSGGFSQRKREIRGNADEKGKTVQAR